MLNSKKYQKLYEEEYFIDRGNDDLRDIMQTQEFKRLSKLIPNKGTVLDIGCGRGEFLALFGKRWVKYGTEVSRFAIAKAKKKGVIFKIPSKNNFFDVILFRGTIQHLNNPFYEIEKRVSQLKPGGYMIFLATPNAGGLYYRIFQDLPMLVPNKNFFIPSSSVLTQSLKNYGLKIKKVYFPYRETPYAKPLRDYLFFVLRILMIYKKKHAFPGNMMEIYAQKANKK